MLSHRKRERKFFLAAHTFVVVHRHTLHLSEECIKQAILDCYARRYEKFVLVILVATVNAFSWRGLSVTNRSRPPQTVSRAKPLAC